MTAALAMPEPRLAPPRATPIAASDRVYLHPGQLAVLGRKGALTTILGSCVGVCLHDPSARVGGLNHYLLPIAPATQPSTRFGDIAVRQLVEEVERLGGDRMRLVATIIGGACVLEAFRGRARDLGRANVDVARATLDHLGITVIAEHVEGLRGRRVVFDPFSGDVIVREL